MIHRFNPPFRTANPPQWRGACAAVAGGGPNRATAIVVARLVFTISGASRAFTALRLIDVVTAVHSHMNELATLEFRLAAAGAPGRRTPARWSGTRAPYAGALLPHPYRHRRAGECHCRGDAIG